MLSNHLKLQVQGIIIMLVIFFYLPGHAQVKIDKNYTITESSSAVNEFVEHNNFDYALVNWYTSTWMSLESSFYALLRKDNKWSLALIKSNKYPKAGILNELIINQIPLQQHQVDSLKTILRPDSTFCYVQKNFDQLPTKCEYKKNGKMTGLLSVSDAATYHLMQFTRGKSTHLYFYAPDIYLERCYPYVPEFGILKGFVNTANTLANTISNRLKK